MLAMHPRLKAKVPKMLEWQLYDADWYIWLDSSCRIKPGADIPKTILSTSKGNPLCLFRHPQGQNIREEANCVRRRLAANDDYFKRRYAGEPIVDQLVHYYGDPGFNDHQLFQMSFFAYHRSAANLMLSWFVENCRWSIEDQISFPYVLQKFKLDFSLLTGTVIDNDLFEWDWGSRENSLNTITSES